MVTDTAIFKRWDAAGRSRERMVGTYSEVEQVLRECLLRQARLGVKPHRTGGAPMTLFGIPLVNGCGQFWGWPNFSHLADELAPIAREERRRFREFQELCRTAATRKQIRG